MMRFTISRCCLSVFLWVFSCPILQGQVKLPVRANPTLPISLTLTAHNGISNCSLPVQVSIRPDRPLLATEKLQLRIFLWKEFADRPELECRFPIEVKPGSSPTSQWIYIPTVLDADAVHVAVVRDGLFVPGFEASSPTTRELLPQYHAQYFNDFVVVLDGQETAAGTPEKFPDLRGLLAWRTGVFVDLEQKDALVPNQAFELVQSLSWRLQEILSRQARVPYVTPLTVDEFCDRWTGMTVQSPVLIERDLLLRLSEGRNKLLERLRESVLMGTELWVYGEAASNLVDQLFGKSQGLGVASDTIIEEFPPIMSVRSATIRELEQRRQLELQGLSTKEDVASTQTESEVLFEVDPLQVSHPYLATPTAAEIGKTLKAIDYGMGKVVAINFGDLSQLSRLHWQLLAPTGNQPQYQPSPQNNYSTPAQLFRLRSALTPRLGIPPIYIFWGLITCFVIGAGPVLYLWLKRRNQLYRIYLWMPLASLLLTLATFLWVVFQEGFRVRSDIARLTFLDSGRGRIDLSTETLFNPRGLHEFTNQANRLVLPLLTFESLEPQRHFRYEATNLAPASGVIQAPQARVVLEDQGTKQHWRGETLRPREQQPFVTFQPTLSEDFLRCNGGKVTNGTSYDLRDLLICEKRDQIWFVEQIQAGETQVAKALTRPDAIKEMQSLAARLLVLKDEPLYFEQHRMLGIPYYRSVNLVRGGDQFSFIEQMIFAWSRTVPPEQCFVGESVSPILDPLFESAKNIGQVHMMMGRLAP